MPNLVSGSVVPLFRVTATLVCVATAVACGGRGTPPRPATAAAPARDAVPVETLYEAGRYEEVVGAVAASGSVAPRDTWLAAASYSRLDRVADARSQLAGLAQQDDPAWQVVARLAMARLDGDAGAMAQALELAGPYTTHAPVQFEAGLALLHRGDFAEAAQAFERSISSDPGFAYAYYQAGLAYQKVGRPDLVASRFESFARGAPDAPERPAVDSILRTMRGQ